MHRHPALAPRLSLAAAGFAWALSAGAATWQLDPDRSVVALLTHRAGVGARLAHDHLVVAPLAGVTLELDADRPEAARLTVAVRADALEIDAAAARARWGGRLAELGALAKGLEPVPEGDRAKVRAAMLGASQLDAARHPELRVELVSLARRGGDGDARPTPGWTARVRLTLRGKTIEKELAVRFELEAGELTAEALGEMRFTELGIEPYSTLLGAIRNDDLFHLFVALAARPVAGEGAAAVEVR
jgi:polyisoprenoid-binding protein YceI